MSSTSSKVAYYVVPVGLLNIFSASFFVSYVATPAKKGGFFGLYLAFGYANNLDLLDTRNLPLKKFPICLNSYYYSEVRNRMKIQPKKSNSKFKFEVQHRILSKLVDFSFKLKNMA